MDAMVNYAREHGYVQTLLGRKRYLPDIHSTTPAVRNFAERNAINTPIQGTAADMIKKAMINIAACSNPIKRRCFCRFMTNFCLKYLNMR